MAVRGLRAERGATGRTKIMITYCPILNKQGSLQFKIWRFARGFLAYKYFYIIYY